MKFYANVSIDAEDEGAATDALKAIPGFIEIIDGPNPDDEDLGSDESEDVEEAAS